MTHSEYESMSWPAEPMPVSGEDPAAPTSELRARPRSPWGPATPPAARGPVWTPPAPVAPASPAPVSPAVAVPPLPPPVVSVPPRTTRPAPAAVPPPPLPPPPDVTVPLVLPRQAMRAPLAIPGLAPPPMTEPPPPPTTAVRPNTTGVALPPPTVVIPQRGPARPDATAALPLGPLPPRPGPRPPVMAPPHTAPLPRVAFAPPPSFAAPLALDAAAMPGVVPEVRTSRRRRRPAKRILLGLLVGLLVGVLVFGAAAYRAGIRGPVANAGTAQESTAEVFGDDKALAALATAWLPAATGCAAKAAARGERTHVSCTLGDLSLHFVRFASVAERDRARLTRRQQHDDTPRLAPDATHLLRRPGASQRTRGEYIEFAYVSGTGAAAPIIAGVWWDNGGEPVAAYAEAPWAKELGSSWTPLRDAWKRHS